MAREVDLGSVIGPQGRQAHRDRQGKKERKATRGIPARPPRQT